MSEYQKEIEADGLFESFEQFCKQAAEDGVEATFADSHLKEEKNESYVWVTTGE